jgi:NAD(P)-dependent dehydrogenase (short-subunit alcohol dehydrogenase family)
MSNSQVWFITGASAGFGQAFATYAIEQGHRVVIAARNAARLATIAALAPDRVLPLTLDVTDPAQVATAATTALAHFGRIDVLINNAGYGTVGAVEETPESELRAQFETNFFGAVSVTRAFLPAFRAQRSGAIVNISSVGGQLSFAGFGPYSASKFALEGLSEALALEMKPFNVKVLIVEPGAFRTDFAGAALKHMPELPAYAETVGGTRAFAHGMHNTQQGDPRKAAIAIATALAAADTPLRLPLGADAVSGIRTHSETLLADLARWESLSLSTTIDPS